MYLNRLNPSIQRYVGGLDEDLNHDFPSLGSESEMFAPEDRPTPAFSGSSHTAVERRRDP